MSFFNLTQTPKIVLKGPKGAKKAPIGANFKTKDGAVFSHIQLCNSSLFQSQFFRVCRCSSPVYFHTNLKPNPPPYYRPTKPQIKPEKYENDILHQNGKNESCFFNHGKLS